MSEVAERPEIDRSKYPASIADDIKWCTGTCGRLTRSTKHPKALAPDTVARQAGGACQTCNKTMDVTKLDPEAHAEAKEPDKEARRKLAATINSLSAFTIESRRRKAERERRAYRQGRLSA